MHRRFIALVLSAALAVTSLNASPVQAGSDEDVAKWIAGLAALAIIGAAVHDNNDRKKKKRYNQSQVHQPRYNHNNHGVNRGQKKRNQFALPGQCRVARNLQGNTIRGFSPRCLKRNNVNVRALPQQCAVRFRDRSQNRPVTLFAGRCLHQYGYRVARH